jgi:broad specificity phosphatase PhoE
MKVYLIRHGAVENPDGINYGTLPGWHLSKEGESQITALGQKIKDEELKICAIVASPLERAQETASILSQALNVKIKTDDRLLEWKTGEWMGKPLKDFYETSGYYSKEMITDGMEPLDDLASRVIASIQDAVNSCDNDIIICSHREPMAAALVKLQNLPWSAIHDIDMLMASVWQLTFEDGQFQSAQKVF